MQRYQIDPRWLRVSSAPYSTSTIFWLGSRNLIQKYFFTFHNILWEYVIQYKNTLKTNICCSIFYKKKYVKPTVTLIYILLSLFPISILMFKRCIFEAGMAGPWLLRYVRCIFISLLSQRHFATTANVIHNGMKFFLKKDTFSKVEAIWCHISKRCYDIRKESSLLKRQCCL